MEEWEEVDIPTHKLKGARWVAVIAEIRENATGDVREYRTEEILDDGQDDPSTFNWAENNYSCDCNRRLFFAQARDEDEDWDSPCSDGKYSVRLRNAKTGRVYYDEFAPNVGGNAPGAARRRPNE